LNVRTYSEDVGRPNFVFAGWCALVLAVATVLVAWHEHLPIRDPNDLAGPTYARLPAILLLAWLLDVVPRAVARSGLRVRSVMRSLRAVMAERWSRAHVLFALSGLGAWYVCYAAFRNLKSYVPFVHPRIYDSMLERIDRSIWLGHRPADVLHSVFGTTWAAQFFSVVYVAWIVLIPITLAIALVWTRRPAAGSWYVTGMAVDWLLGVGAYFLVPTLGPIYSYPQDFAALPHTYATTLQHQLLTDRRSVLADPHATHALQTIAAFPSLHVGMMVTLCLFATWAGMARWIQVTSRIFLALTMLATVYLGWHFFVDVLGGAVLGALGAWIAALATGNHVGGQPRLLDERADARAEPAAASHSAGTISI
jgi:membrane-associated phospholipid phosphatase